MCLLREAGEFGQTFTGVGVAEERIECFFHLLQVLPHFLGHVDEHVALGFARAGRFDFRSGQVAPLDQRQQACALVGGAHGEIVVQYVFAFYGVLDEQQCGGHFKIGLFMLAAQAGSSTQCVEQFGQTAFGEQGHLRLHVGELVPELRQLARLAFDGAVPAVARSLQAMEQGVEHWPHLR